MHLPKLPTIFTKDGEQRKVYHTVEARELSAAGWVEVAAQKPADAEVTKPSEEKETVEEKPKAVKPKTVALKETEIEEFK